MSRIPTIYTIKIHDSNPNYMYKGNGCPKISICNQANSDLLIIKVLCNALIATFPGKMYYQI